MSGLNAACETSKAFVLAEVRAVLQYINTFCAGRLGFILKPISWRDNRVRWRLFCLLFVFIFLHMALTNRGLLSVSILMNKIVSLCNIPKTEKIC